MAFFCSLPAARGPRGHAANDVNASSGTKLAEGHGAPWEGRPPRPAVSIRHHKAGERDQDTPPISGSLVLSRSACSVVRSRLAVAEYFLFSLLPELPLLPRDRILAFSLAMFSDLGGFVQSNPVWLWMQESLSRSALRAGVIGPRPAQHPGVSSTSCRDSPFKFSCTERSSIGRG